METIRRAAWRLAACAVLAACAAGAAGAAEYAIDASRPTDATQNRYATLEELRLAVVAGTAALGAGDAIVLHNDDRTITANFDLTLPGAGTLTVKSNAAGTPRVVGPGPGYAASSGSVGDPAHGGMFDFRGANEATLALEAVAFMDHRISGNYASLGGAVRAEGPLTVSGAGVSFVGNAVDGGTLANLGRGGAVYAAGRLGFTDGTYAFTGNAATGGAGAYSGQGGAVYAAGQLDFTDGTYAFTGNAATGTGSLSGSGLGGALYAGGTLNLAADGTYTFVRNSVTGGASTSTGWGGAVYANTGFIAGGGGDYVFSGNTATGGAGGQTGRGGAVYAGSGGATFTDGDYRFVGNAADGAIGANSGWGGALYSYYPATFAGGTYAFVGNSATGGSGDDSGNGGAVYSFNELTLKSGDFAFVGNRAGQAGGAVYAAQAATLAADGGNALFSGNTANGAANAAYFQNANGGKTVNLAAKAGQSVVFLDPIASNSAPGRHDLSVHINQTDAVADGGAYAGTVRFDKHHSQIYGATTVHNGTMTLSNGATYGASKTVGSFALGNNATLYARGADNKILANAIDVTGARLAFDLTGITAGDAASIGLVLDGTTVAGDVGAVDLRAFDGAGTFNLVKRTNGVFTAASAAANVTVRGEALSSTRAGGATVELNGPANDTLQLNAAGVANGVVEWTGASGGLWNATSQNWKGLVTIPDAEKRFLHGDAVKFDGAGGSVAIQAAGVGIAARGANAGMEIASGDWTFSGGAIEGGGIAFTGSGSATFDGLSEDGGATKTARIMEQRVTVAGANTEAAFRAAEGATVTFLGLGDGVASGGAISADTDTALTLGADGAGDRRGTLAFLGNTVTGGAGNDSGLGGAVHADGALTFAAGDYAFTGNTATGGAGDYSGLGGAVYAGDALTFTAGDYAFTGNTATGLGSFSGWGGAVYANRALTFTAGDYAFTGNTATGGAGNDSGRGGAVYTDDALTFTAGDYAFTGNTATGGAGNQSGWGGAVYAYGALTFAAGDYAFTGNSAIAGTGTGSGRGGAIYANDSLVLAGDHTFTGNTAVGTVADPGQGGAIYALKGATLAADGGDILFSGNTTHDGSAATPTANAVHFANDGNSNVVHLAAKDGQRLTFLDPVSSDSTNTNLSIHINQTNAVAGKGAYTGTVRLDGYHSQVHGDTTVHNGTLLLTGGATYGAASSVGAFALGDAATPTVSARLAADTAGNKVQASAIALSDNAVLAFDLAGAVASDQVGATTNLAFAADTSFAGKVGAGRVEATNFAAPTVAGTAFLLADAGAADRAADTGDLYLNGATTPSHPQRSTVAGALMHGLAVDAGGRYLQLKTVDATANSDAPLVWTGTVSQAGLSHWNATAANWYGHVDGVAVRTFLAGDDVVFDDTAINKDVTVAAGMTVDTMTVTGTDYTFHLNAGDAPAITATTGIDFNNATLDIAGYATDSVNPFMTPVLSRPVVVSGSAIQNFDPATITIAGAAAVDFLTAYVSVSPGQDVLSVETNLTWYSFDPARPAHGNFTIGAGNTFTLAAELMDNGGSPNKDPFWDGKSLTKAGDGTLILAVRNTHSGGTVITGGKIVAQHAKALGTGAVDLGAFALDLAFDGVLPAGNVLSGSGTSALGIHGDVAVRHANSAFSGVATVAADKTLTLGHANAFQSAAVSLGRGSILALETDATLASLSATDAAIDLGAGAPKTLSAATFALGGANTVLVDVAAAGTYTLLQSTADVAAWNASIVNARTVARDSRKDGANTLQYRILDDGPAVLAWTDAAGTGVWNTTDRNWADADDFVFRFADGDHVVFGGGAANKAVTVADGGVRVGDMAVTATGYAFDLGGNSITAAGNVDLADATLVLALAYDGTTKAAGHIVADGSITAAGGELRVKDDDKVLVAAIREAGAADFAVLQSGGAMNASFASLSGFSSDFFDVTHGAFGNQYRITVAYNDEARFVDYAPRGNMNAVARHLDALMNDPAMQDLINGLIGDEATIVAGLDSLRTSEIVPNALALSLWSPWTHAWRRLDTVNAAPWPGAPTARADGAPEALASFEPRGGLDANRIWLDGIYQYADISSDGVARAHDLRRAGFTLGYDHAFSDAFQAGALFAYGDNRLNAPASRLDADDYTFGLYASHTPRSWLRADGFVGYGRQRYDYHRTDIAGSHRAEYDGEAFYAALQFSAPFAVATGFRLGPVAGLDYQKAWTDAFTESGAYGQHIAKARQDTLTGRLGVAAEWTAERVRLHARAGYGRDLDGANSPNVTARFAAAGPGTPAMTLRGVETGRDHLDVGLGFETFLDAAKRVSLYGDYDFAYAKRSRTHTGHLGLALRW